MSRWSQLEASLQGRLLRRAGPPWDRDASSAEPVPPAAVVVAACEADVVATMRWSHEHGVPVVPRGGGTGKAGGCVPSPGSVVLALGQLDRIEAVRAEDGWAEVQAGVITSDFQQAVAERGLYYPPDPGAWGRCTLGGNAATNAGGPAALRYGVTRDYVLGLRAVLPDGRVLETGKRQRKGVAGYDLAQLLVGSEGTLAVITGLRLRLLPQPRMRATALLAFANVAEAVDGVLAAQSAGVRPRSLELIDGTALRRAGHDPDYPQGDGWGAVLIAEFDGAPGQAERDLERFIAELRSAPLEVRRAADEAEREQLWHMRRQTSRLVKVGSAGWVSEDVAVPSSALAGYLRRLGELGGEGIDVFAYGHAGDGNLHVNVVWEQPDAGEQAEGIVQRVIDLALQAGGTVSGEHGIGTLKRPFLRREVGDDALALMRGLKAVFDPRGLLNPGKVLGA